MESLDSQCVRDSTRSRDWDMVLLETDVLITFNEDGNICAVSSSPRAASPQKCHRSKSLVTAPLRPCLPYTGSNARRNVRKKVRAYRSRFVEERRSSRSEVELSALGIVDSSTGLPQDGAGGHQKAHLITLNEDDIPRKVEGYSFGRWVWG